METNKPTTPIHLSAETFAVLAGEHSTLRDVRLGVLHEALRQLLRLLTEPGNGRKSVALDDAGLLAGTALVICASGRSAASRTLQERPEILDDPEALCDVLLAEVAALVLRLERIEAEGGSVARQLELPL